MGLLSGQKDDQKNCLATVGIVDDAGQFHAQGEVSALTLIVNPEVSLGITANEKAETAINLGDHIVYEVTAENISDVLLKDVEVVVEFGTLGVKNYGLERVLDFNTLNDEHDGKSGARSDPVDKRANSGARGNASSRKRSVHI